MISTTVFGKHSISALHGCGPIGLRYSCPLALAQLTKRTTDNPTASELKYGQHVRAKLQEPFLRQQHHDKFELLTVGLM